MPEQLPLRYEPGAYHKAHWHRVLAEMNRVIAIVGLQEAAYDLDTSPSYLAHALAERDKYPRAEWVVYCLIKDPTTGLAQALMAAPGLNVSKPMRLTPEQKLTRLEGVLGESLGPDLREAIFRRAYGEGERDR